MKVTLIYAGIGVAGFNANRPLGDREGSWMPHGLASIGASVRAAGYETNLIDLRQLSGWTQFSQLIQVAPSEIYGVSVSAVDYYAALKVIYEIKSRQPESKVIVGGIHPTVFPQEYDYGVIDCVVTGEGEITFVKLLKELETGQLLPKMIQGEKPALDALPWAARDLFEYDQEMSCNFAPDQALPSITMLAGRGCPFECSYCQPAENAVFGRPFRMRSPENVMAELASLYEKYGFKSITFWDDTFTFNRKWIDDFADLYRRSEIKANIAACSRADIICNNEAMIENMASIGVDWLVIGLESGSQRLLDLIKKGTTVEQNYRAAEICRKYGIKIFGTYMYGLPTETKEESNLTRRMIKDIYPEHDSPFWYVPIPGTGLYEYCQMLNLLLQNPETIERTGRFNPAIKGVDYQHIANIMNG